MGNGVWGKIICKERIGKGDLRIVEEGKKEWIEVCVIGFIK